MTTFTESSTGLGLVLPEAAHTSWEGIAWQNQHLSGWVAAAQSRSTRLLTGTLANDQLTGLEVNWVLEDGTVLRRKCADHTLTYAPGERKVLYLDFDQMDATEPSKQAVLEMTPPLFADFHPSEKLFPLVHFGQYQETSTAATDFALWLAPKDLQGISAQVMPVGTVLMYDGGSWVDDVTMKGWYACQGQSTPYGNTPNLTDKFLMGGNSSGATGGNASTTLATANLPSHTHSIDHDHPSQNFTSNSIGHDHHYRSNSTYGPGLYPGHVAYNITSGANWTHGGSLSAAGGTDGAHTHTTSVDLAYLSGTSGATGSGTAFENRPPFYSVIYIKRMA